MLQLTKRTEYGLIALTYLAGRPSAVVSVREVCEHYPVPRRLLAEVLKELAHAGLVHSHRGASGGYSLARPAEAISVGDVVGALEGLPSLTSCVSVGAAVAHFCELEPLCPIKSPIDTLRLEFWRMLQRTTLRDLSGRSAARSPLPALLSAAQPR